MRTSAIPSNPTSARGGPQSVGRVFAILESLAGRGDGATLTELAVETGAPKTSLVGLLAGLTHEGCLLRDVAGRYRLGPRFLSLAMRAVAGRDLVALFRPELEALVGATGETAVLGVLAPDADVATYLDRIESSNPIRYAVTIGERRELYCTAMGKALLAQFPADRLRRYLKDTKRERFTATTLTGQRELMAEMARIRAEGIARTHGERFADASGVAAPIFAGDGSTVAALLIAGPSERMQAHADENERQLRRSAAACTRLAGGEPAPAAGQGGHRRQRR